ncbi:hypothetical protein F7U66_00160 [Vibrio parahaemolyticus]|nr:hypothetical protein [Vibrio parahaemolyticus]
MTNKLYFDSFEELYDSLSEESIDQFWKVFSSHYPPGHNLHVDTTDMTIDDKIEIAWRILSTFPVIENRIIEK